MTSLKPQGETTMENVTSTVISKDGTSISYETTGTGPTLVMIDPGGGFHGWRPMAGLIPLLAPHFTVVTYDRRGRGYSGDTQPYTPDREIDDLEALINAVGAPAFVFGFSSSAVLSLLAADRDLPITKLVLLEPPLESYDEAQPASSLETEVADLVAKGERREAYFHFNRGIGVPEEIMEAEHANSNWDELEAMAHTIVYDLHIIRTLPTPLLAQITTPTLIIASEVTGEPMMGWTKATADALPNGQHLTMAGNWHGVPPEMLAPKMIEFFNS
jgi:pimeloyl-ACP methyl ester carboxylesterase